MKIRGIFSVYILLSILLPQSLIFAQELMVEIDDSSEVIEEMVADPGELVKIGVLAKRGYDKAVSQWGSTADYLSSHIDGYYFEIVPLTFEEIEPAVETKSVDFILANSSIYVTLEVLYDVNRIVTMINKEADTKLTEFGSVIFWKADRDDIDLLQCSKGINFGAVDETSFGGWLMTLFEFEEHDICSFDEVDSLQLEFLDTHDAVVHAVLNDSIDVGTVRTDTLERMDGEGLIDIEDIFVLPHSQLHAGSDFDHVQNFPLLHSTRLYPEWPMAKLAHTDDHIANLLASALLGMLETDPAVIAANISGWNVPLNYQSVHNLLQTLKLKPYENYGEISFLDFIKQEILLISIVVSGVIVIAILAIIGFILSLRFRKSRDEVEQLFEGSIDSFLKVSSKGKILKVNQATVKMFGYDRGVIQTMSVFDLQKPESVKKAKAIFAGVSDDKIRHFERELMCSDSSTVYVDISTSVIDNNTILIVMRDIGERKENEKHLSDKSDELQRMNQLMIGRELKMAELKEQLNK